MDKCRICLGIKKTLMSIYENAKETTYCEMITSIANVNIHKDDGITDQICRGCCKNLSEAYDLKLLIERSDLVLNENSNLKKLKFNSINDIKIEIELFVKPALKQEDTAQCFTQGVDEFQYRNTLIKKVKSIQCNEMQQPIPVLDFLNSIEEDHENNINYDNTSDIDLDTGSIDNNDGDYEPDDDDYAPHNTEFSPDVLLPQKQVKKTRQWKRHNYDYEVDDEYLPASKGTKPKTPSRKSKSDNSRFMVPGKEVCIKPVHLKDLRVLRLPPKTSIAKKKYTLKKKMCPHCGKMVTTIDKHILTKHSGSPNHKCDMCNKAFHSIQQVNKHKQNIHSAIKDFKCDQCVAAFANKYTLQSHKLRHSEEKKFVCEVCSKRFKRRSGFYRHRLMHNSLNKSKKCELCSMSFFTNPSLRHHMRVHTGERPFNCEICSQPYSYKHDFNRHCLKKHGVFLKCRPVYVMNEEVLKREQELMRDLVLRVNGLKKDDKPLNPFEGPQGALAFEKAIKALQAEQIPITLCDINIDSVDEKR